MTPAKCAKELAAYADRRTAAIQDLPQEKCCSCRSRPLSSLSNSPDTAVKPLRGKASLRNVVIVDLPGYGRHFQVRILQMADHKRVCRFGVCRTMGIEGR